MKKLILLTPFILVSVFSCTKDSTTTNTNCVTSNMKFSSDIKPLIVSNCNGSSCHNATDKASNIDLSAYAGIKAIANSGRLISTINSGSMPKNASKLSQCNIDKIQSWVTAGALDN